MPRRVHVSQLMSGQMQLDQRNSHYLRDVLRMKAGMELELFDDAGRNAAARILDINAAGVMVEVEAVREPSVSELEWTIASAVPKGNRADWMVEKLSEFGASCWIPLITERSVVHPDSTNKPQRWQRIAEESARQCRRGGVMRIEALTPLEEILRRCAQPPAVGFCLHPEGGSISEMMNLAAGRQPIFLIGPEGGWSERELSLMEAGGIGRFSLAATILRIETAAIAVAAIVQARKF